MVNGVDVLGTIGLTIIGFVMGALAMRILWLMSIEDEAEREKNDEQKGRRDSDRSH